MASDQPVEPGRKPSGFPWIAVAAAVLVAGLLGLGVALRQGADEAPSASRDSAAAGAVAEQSANASASATPDASGWITTSSGLRYRMLETGSGAAPQLTSRVLVHYEGSLLDGTVFDSSYERGRPIRFSPNELIPGFTEGLMLMREGSKIEMIIPAKLAYGSRKNNGPIPPNSDLRFVVELRDVM